MYMMPNRNSIYLNPAFAGYEGKSRVGFTYVNQWPSMSGSYVTSAIVNDYWVDAMNSGFGLYIHRDQAGQNTLISTRISHVYSYHHNISGKWRVSHGVDLSYFTKKLDWSNLTFGDMIDPRAGYIYETQDTPRGGKVQNVDFGLGIIVTYDKLNLGYSVHHINEPNESLVVGLSRLPRRQTLHASADFPMVELEGKYLFSISPIGSFIVQAKRAITNVGTAFNFFGCYIGFSYSVGYFDREKYYDNLLLSTGYKFGGYSFAYCYAQNLSGLTPSIGGSHELNMCYSF